MNITRTLTAGSAAAVLTFALAAGPVDARVDQKGLINVAVTNTTIQVPIGVAANVCDVSASVLARAVSAGDVDCNAEGVAIAEDNDPGDGDVTQNGLVNVALTDTVVQVPIALAANICDVNVAVLAAAADIGDTVCNAEGVSIASAE